MIAALATIIFLAAAWAAIVAIAGSIEMSGTKIAAALRGQEYGLRTATVRISPRSPKARSQRVHARPALRAAA